MRASIQWTLPVKQWVKSVPEPTPPMMNDRMALMVNLDSGAMMESVFLVGGKWEADEAGLVSLREVKIRV